MSRKLVSLTVGVLLAVSASTAAGRVVVVVAAENPLQSLTRAQLADVYLGRLTRLPDGEAVVPVDQVERSPAHDRFYGEYLERTPAQIKAHWSKLIFTGRGMPPRAVSDGDAVVRFIAGNPRAIGYLDATLVDDRLRILEVE